MIRERSLDVHLTVRNGCSPRPPWTYVPNDPVLLRARLRRINTAAPPVTAALVDNSSALGASGTSGGGASTQSSSPLVPPESRPS